MKKFISMVMAAAMVASLVPATAFAKGEVSASVKVVDALNITKDEAQAAPAIVDNASGTTEKPADQTKWNNKVPELQMTITNTDYRNTQPGDEPELDVTLSLDNAIFAKKDGTTPANDADLMKLVNIMYDEDSRTNGTKAVFTESATGTDLHKPGTSKDDDISVASLTNTTAGADTLKWMLTTFDLKLDLSAVTADVYYDSDKTDTTDAVKVIDAATHSYVTANCADDEAFIDLVAGITGNAQFQNQAATTGATTWVIGTDFNVSVNSRLPLAAPAGKVNLTTAGLATDFASVSSADQIKLYTDAGYVRGDWTSHSSDATPAGKITIEVIDKDDDQVTYRFTGRFAKNDIIVFDLDSVLDKTGTGRQATVSVSSAALSSSVNDLVYVSVGGRGLSASTRKVVNVAEEEKIKLDSDLRIKSTVGDFNNDQWFELKLSKGFVFGNATDDAHGGTKYVFDGPDDNTLYVKIVNVASLVDENELIIDKDDIEIEADTAKSGAACTITVKAVTKGGTTTTYDPDTTNTNSFSATTTVEVAKVVDYKVVLSVDEDEDVPVIYSGVNVDNYGITDDSDHMSLEVTAEETFPGAWSMRKGFNFELPEGVYVTDVTVNGAENFFTTKGNDNDEVNDTEWRDAFWNAYQEGSHVNFEFEKRVFDDVNTELADEIASVTFQLELVADPTFEGDVVLKLTGDLVDEQEVTIAKFVKPYTVKAEQNDMIIDYRYTDIPTAITITEAEKGLWAKKEATFWFAVEKNDFIVFEDDPTFEIDSKSGLEIKNDGVKGSNVTIDGVQVPADAIRFTVDVESDEAATVTIKDMQLFMQRSIPAGPYDLSIGSSLAAKYEAATLFAPDDSTGGNKDVQVGAQAPANTKNAGDKPFAYTADGGDNVVGDVCDYSDTVKEAFVNVVTAGRDVDDASFTTKVVVPVGESYIVAGEKQIDLDTPAYINAAGYTMLPIRAVATALGISNNNVLWDQPTKTVTILYGQRIITMTQGQKVVYVNGSAIPASAAVENTNSRTFLPMRDLATALGVTDITWDQATRTATLNGNQK